MGKQRRRTREERTEAKQDRATLSGIRRAVDRGIALREVSEAGAFWIGLGAGEPPAITG